MPADRIKLCIVTPTHWKAFMGGAQYQVKCLLDALLARDRYEIHYLARAVDSEFRPQGYRIVRIGNRNRMPRLGYVMDAIPLYRRLRALRPDVIYQRVGCGYTGIAAHYARMHDARMIWHVAHETDVTRENLSVNSLPFVRLLEKASIEYGLRHATQIVVQTEEQARLLRANYGRDAAAVILNFHPEPREALDKPPQIRVVWVANLKPWKRPEVFVRVAQRLRDLPGVRFVMVGAAAKHGSLAWQDALMKDIDATPNLEFLGQKTQDEVNELLAGAHLFVNTSLHEGFPNTFIQAWMRAVPVVSMNVDPDGVLERQEVGIHAASEDRLVEAVRLLIVDSTLRARYAENARRHALLRHSVRNAELLVHLIETGRTISMARAAAPLAPR